MPSAKRTKNAPALAAAPIGTPHRLDVARLVADLSARLGFPVHVETSQNGASIQHGESKIEIPGARSSFGEPRLARGRKEGLGRPGTMPLLHPFGAEDGWYAAFLDWAVDILAAGRTVEVGAGIGLESFLNRIALRAQACDHTFSSLIRMIDGTWSDEACMRIDLDPEYQREHVWSDERAERFVGYWLEGGDVPKIYIQRYDGPRTGGPDYDERPMEVLDGKQRLRALWRWAKGEIAAEITDGRRFWYRDTNEIERRGLSVRLHLIDLTLVERLRFYLLLNRGGVPHTDAEIDRVKRRLAEAEAAEAIAGS